MTPKWKADVRAAMKTRGISEQQLADLVGERRGVPMKRDTINKMLRRQAGSALVPDVCAILGLSPPMTATADIPDAETAADIELMLSAPPDVRRAIRLLLIARSKVV